MATVLGPHAPRHPSTYRKPSASYKPSSHHPSSSHPSQNPTSSASASTSHSSHHHSDSYYGHEETAKLCARFVSHTFNCPEMLPPTTAVTTTSASNPSVPPTLAHFVAYALHRTRLHPSVTFTALALLSRLKTRFPAARGSSGHRLFLSAFMIASKVVCDDTYSNKSWAVVGQGMFALREINQMEREMCAYLEWHLNVPEEDLRAFEREVRKVYSSPPPYAPGTSVTLGSTASNASVSNGASTTATGATTSSAPITHLSVPESKDSSADRIPLANAQLPTPTDGPTIMPFTQPSASTITSKPILAPINTNFVSRQPTAAAAGGIIQPASKSHNSSMPTPPASPPPCSASSQSTTGATLGYELSSGPNGSSPITDSPSPSSSEDSLPTPPNAQWTASYAQGSSSSSTYAHVHAHPQLAKSMSLPTQQHQGGGAVSVAVARQAQPHGGRTSMDGVGVGAEGEAMEDEKRGVAYYTYAPVQVGGPHMALKQQQQAQQSMRGAQRSQSLPGQSSGAQTSGQQQQQQGQQGQQTTKQQRGTGRTFTVPCTW